MDYEDHVTRLSEDYPALAAGVSPLRGLEGVMAWMSGRGIPLSEAEIVAQDEYSLDFIVPLEKNTHLAFGIT